MKLNLKRPLAFFDLETTGTDVGRDRIVEIAVIKLMPDGQINKLPSGVDGDRRLLVNPGVPIPVESSLVHGIYDEHVKDAPTFAELAPKLFKFMFDCDLAGFNSNKFDIPLLAEEFLRAGVDFSIEGRNLIDVQVLFHLMEPRTLKAAYRFYCNKNLEDAHEALADTTATLEVLEAMIERYEGVTITDARGKEYVPVVNDIDHIHRTTMRQRRADLAGHLVYDDQGRVVFNFGKYKGQPIDEVFSKDIGYFGWIQGAEFPLYTKKVLRDLRAGHKPV